MLAYRLALRAAPDPWALGATAAVGLSAPLLAYSTAVYPELAAGAALTGAALLALQLDERAGRRRAFGCFALLGDAALAGRALPAGGRGHRRRRRPGDLALAPADARDRLGRAVAVQRRPGGRDRRGALRRPHPLLGLPRRRGPVGSSSALDRVYRLPGLFVDPQYGLLRWAPLLLLAFLGLWWLWRSRRERLARAVPQLHGVELTAGLCAAVFGVQLVVAALFAPTANGDWFPGAT